MSDEKPGRAKRALKRTAHDWRVVLSVVVPFSVVMCLMAKSLSDGSEAMTILIGGALSVFTLIVTNLLGKSGE